MTVSRVLTGRGYVADETARRVRAVLERLDYQPNPVARLLRGRRSQLIGVTMPSLTSTVHRGIVAGLEEVLGGAGYEIVLGHLAYGRQPSSTFVEIAQRQHCDGFVLVPSRADAGKVAPSLNRPTVVAHSALPGLECDAVLTDGQAAARSATELLLERFGAPVAFVGFASGLSHEDRLLRGYLDAIRAAGVEARVVDSPPNEIAGAARVAALLDRADEPRGFLFASTMHVFEGLGALVQAGRRIGHDVGVVATVTEEQQWTALLPEPIPLMVIPAREIGRRAGRLLLRRFEVAHGPSQVERIPMHLQAPEPAWADRTGFLRMKRG